MVPKSLQLARKKIDQLDQKLVQLIQERQNLGREIARVKEHHHIPLTDAVREGEVLQKILKGVHDPLMRASLKDIYAVLMRLSKQTRLEQVKSFSHPVSIGIIGYGRFGQLLVKTFQAHWGKTVVKVHARDHKPDAETFFSLSDVAQCDLVIPCVPISAFDATLRKIKGLLRSDTVVVDICSVKVKTTAAMRKILSKKQPLISTHPMFGPDSTAEGAQFLGLNMMMHNISAPQKTYELFKSFWQNLGVNTVEMTPAQHDKDAAYTMNYAHLIGRIGELVKIKPTRIDTKGFKILYEVLQHVVNDSWQLFADMQNYNPYAKEMREKIMNALRDIERRIKSRKSVKSLSYKV